jgi:hypothetical protein
LPRKSPPERDHAFALYLGSHLRYSFPAFNCDNQ